ncbi:hypothetical protein E3P99_02974 [Wallemia hederae]|uniref:F-box domain-containing protein n=1 Tax=Wallemia hederae TaxID=1540922 RepID=A0A4T0FLZ8_9BASI|nr:hypothetical protein E3P99_02974 [Wallemia hederae]
MTKRVSTAVQSFTTVPSEDEIIEVTTAQILGLRACLGHNVISSMSSSSISEDTEMSDFNALQQIPDLRFEEVFIKAYNESSGSLAAVVRMLVVDQVLLPLIQGSLWGVGVSLFTRYAPNKSRIVKDAAPVESSSSHSDKKAAQRPSPAQFHLLKLPNELIELVTDELSFNNKLLTSVLNRRLRLVTIKKLFSHTKLTRPVSRKDLSVIGSSVKHLTITFNPDELQCLQNTKTVDYVSNEPLSNSTMTQFTTMNKLEALTLDVTIIMPSSTSLRLPSNLKQLKLSFRDDKDVHGNDPPHNMEIFSEDQIWYSIVLMSKLVEANAATLEKLNLKLLLPINTLSNSKWPNLRELSVVRSFPNNNFVAFLANAPVLETLYIHGRPNNEYWIGQAPISDQHKLLGSLKHLTLAATTIQGDYMFSHLNTHLESFTVEDQLSTRSSYMVLDGLRGIQLQTLRLEPLTITLDWLMVLADTIPSLRQLHCRYSRLRKHPHDTLPMLIEALSRFAHLEHLSLGWDLDDECDDTFNVVERDMEVKQTEFYHNLAFLSSINNGRRPSAHTPMSVDSSSAVTNSGESTASPLSHSTSITTPMSDLSSPGVALSPGVSSVDSMRDELRKTWNRRSNARYWDFAESVSKRIPSLKSLNLKRYNVMGEREEIIFALHDGRIKAGRWIPEEAFPTTSKAFLL